MVVTLMEHQRKYHFCCFYYTEVYMHHRNMSQSRANATEKLLALMFEKTFLTCNNLLHSLF